MMVHPRGRALTGQPALPAGLHPLERAFAQDRDPRKESRQKIDESMRDARPILDETRDRLTQLGLLMDDVAAWRARLLPTLPYLKRRSLGLGSPDRALTGQARHLPDRSLPAHGHDRVPLLAEAAVSLSGGATGCGPPSPTEPERCL